MIRRTLVLAAALALSPALSSSVGRAQPAQPAHAPTAEQLEAAKQAFAEGKTLYDAGRAAEAVEKFKESYRLSGNPLLLYNIGFTFDGLGQKDLALFYYRKFLTDAPDTPQTAEQRAAAKTRSDALAAELTAPAAPEPAPPPPARTFTAADFQHQVVDEAPPGQPLDLTAAIPEGAAWQVTLFYRGANAATFTSVPMKPRYRELVGRIPAAIVRGASIQYYVEVRDAHGAVVTRVGRPSSPNLVYLEATAQPRFYPDLSPPDEPTPAPITSPTITATAAPQPRIRAATWASSGAAAGLLALAVGFHLAAAHDAASLEAEAVLSGREPCDGGPPCRVYEDRLKDIESRGETFELIANVSLGVGVATAAVAGWLWYRDLSVPRVAPVIGAGVVGAAAEVRF